VFSLRSAVPRFFRFSVSVFVSLRYRGGGLLFFRLPKHNNEVINIIGHEPYTTTNPTPLRNY